jgi:hypothetical protein
MIRAAVIRFFAAPRTTDTAATCGASLTAVAVAKARVLVAVVVVMALGHQAPMPYHQPRR